MMVRIVSGLIAATAFLTAVGAYAHEITFTPTQSTGLYYWAGTPITIGMSGDTASLVEEVLFPGEAPIGTNDGVTSYSDGVFATLRLLPNGLLELRGGESMIQLSLDSTNGGSLFYDYGTFSISLGLSPDHTGQEEFDTDGLNIFGCQFPGGGGTAGGWCAASGFWAFDPAPEPSAFSLLMAGLGGLGGWRMTKRRRYQKAAATSEVRDAPIGFISISYGQPIWTRLGG